MSGEQNIEDFKTASSEQSVTLRRPSWFSYKMKRLSFMLAQQTYPVRVEIFSCVNAFFCSNKFNRCWSCERKRSINLTNIGSNYFSSYQNLCERMIYNITKTCLQHFSIHVRSKKTCFRGAAWRLGQDIRAIHNPLLAVWCPLCKTTALIEQFLIWHYNQLFQLPSVQGSTVCDWQYFTDLQALFFFKNNY